MSPIAFASNLITMLSPRTGERVLGVEVFTHHSRHFTYPLQAISSYLVQTFLKNTEGNSIPATQPVARPSKLISRMITPEDNPWSQPSQKKRNWTNLRSRKRSGFILASLTTKNKLPLSSNESKTGEKEFGFSQKTDNDGMTANADNEVSLVSSSWRNQICALMKLMLMVGLATAD